jgi:hypothetical protein
VQKVKEFCVDISGEDTVKTAYRKKSEDQLPNSAVRQQLIRAQDNPCCLQFPLPRNTKVNVTMISCELWESGNSKEHGLSL